MGSFNNWLECPQCPDEVGVLCHSTDIVLECYGCGYISEFTIGQDVPVQGLSTTVIEDEMPEITRFTRDDGTRPDETER